MQHIFITGANRGIGLELIRQYLARPETELYAAVRVPDNAADLKALSEASGDRVVIVPLEVSDTDAIQTAAHAIGQRTDRIDLLINNAGVDPKSSAQRLETITPELMLDVYRINTVAPLMIVQAFLGLLKRGSLPKVVNITSEMGSLADRDYGGYYAYCTSKAALNMVTRGLAADLIQHGIVTVALDPGWVQTDMGGEDADLTPEESVRGILRVIDGLTRQNNGAFLRWNGRTLPW